MGAGVSIKKTDEKNDEKVDEKSDETTESKNKIKETIKSAIEEGVEQAELLDLITGELFFSFDNITGMPLLSGSYKKFGDAEYCKESMMLLSEASAKLLTDFEIKTISDRIQNGVQTEKNNYLVVNMSNIKKSDIQSSDEKEKACAQIADFYIKVAHCFSAILFAINPQFIDVNSKPHSIKSKYENNVVSSESKSNTVVDQRINLFSIKKNKDEDEEEDEEYEVDFNLCNASSLDRGSLDRGSFIALAQLFKSNETFSDLTDKQQERIDELLRVYSMMPQMNNADEQPDEHPDDQPDGHGGGNTHKDNKSIKTLIESMKLFNYNTICDDSRFNPDDHTVSVSASNTIFNKVRKHFEDMQNKMELFSNMFNDYLAKLFDIKITNDTKIDVIVSPKLTIDSLNELIHKLRMELVEFYISSEENFHKLLLMFDSLASSTEFETNFQTQKSLEKSLEES